MAEKAQMRGFVFMTGIIPNQSKEVSDTNESLWAFWAEVCYNHFKT
jgi:hypothetical protein